jgi:hypothetical protein
MMQSVPTFGRLGELSGNLQVERISGRRSVTELPGNEHSLTVAQTEATSWAMDRQPRLGMLVRKWGFRFGTKETMDNEYVAGNC